MELQCIILYIQTIKCIKQEPGNAPRIGIGHREVVCQK